MLHPKRIVLVRHGPSSHEHTGWIDAAGFARWREAYENAGIRGDEVPPPELQKLTADASALVTSDARRAIDSGTLLAPAREWMISPLLRELDLPPLSLGPVRLPLVGWALAFGVRFLVRPLITTVERERVQSAARWLVELAEMHGTVVAVTHASFRNALARQLASLGWRGDPPRPRTRHWSAWTLESGGEL